MIFWKKILPPPSLPPDKSPIWIMLAGAIIGFSDSIFLSYKHFAAAVPPCLTNGGRCGDVLAGAYSSFLGVPLSVLGVIYYSLIISGIVFCLTYQTYSYLRLVAWVAIGGFFFSGYLIYLQLFVIRALCPYCVLSATVSAVLMVASIVWLKKNP